MRTVVIMCQERFAPAVEFGSKPHTIRKIRKDRPVQVGAKLSLRAWLGKPYRSKQRILREAICTRVRPISIFYNRGTAVRKGGITEVFVQISLGEFVARRPGGKAWPKYTTGPLTWQPATDLARADGCQGISEMLTWFRDTHGLPFSGVLIDWGLQKV